MDAHDNPQPGFPDAVLETFRLRAESYATSIALPEEQRGSLVGSIVSAVLRHFYTSFINGDFNEECYMLVELRIKFVLEFRRLMVSEGSRMYGYARKKGCNEELAKDVVQDVFVNATRKSFEAIIEEPIPYLYRCVDNRIVDHIRNKSRLETMTGIGPEWSTKPRDEKSGEASERDNAMADTIAAFKRTLTDNEKVTLDACIDTDWNNVEMANRLGDSSVNIRKRVSRLKSKMKDWGEQNKDRYPWCIVFLGILSMEGGSDDGEYESGGQIPNNGNDLWAGWA